MFALTGLAIGLGCLVVAALISFPVIDPVIDARFGVNFHLPRLHRETAPWFGLTALSIPAATTLVGWFAESPIGAFLTGLTVVISTIPLLLRAERSLRRIDGEVALEVAVSGLATDDPVYIPDAWR